MVDYRIHAVADDSVEFVRESRISFDVDRELFVVGVDEISIRARFMACCLIVLVITFGVFYFDPRRQHFAECGDLKA